MWPVLMGEAQPYSGPRTPDGRVSHGGGGTNQAHVSWFPWLQLQLQSGEGTCANLTKGGRGRATGRMWGCGDRWLGASWLPDCYGGQSLSVCLLSPVTPDHALGPGWGGCRSPDGVISPVRMTSSCPTLKSLEHLPCGTMYTCVCTCGCTPVCMGRRKAVSKGHGSRGRYLCHYCTPNLAHTTPPGHASVFPPVTWG